MIKVRYIQCMDFIFRDVFILGYSSIYKLMKDLNKGKFIEVQASDGNVDCVNSNYIMYIGF